MPILLQPTITTKLEITEAQQRELATRFQKRVAITFAGTVLGGKKSIRVSELLGLMGLRRKRRSIQQAAVAMVMTPLRADGVLPRDFKVIG